MSTVLQAHCLVVHNGDLGQQCRLSKYSKTAFCHWCRCCPSVAWPEQALLLSCAHLVGVPRRKPHPQTTASSRGAAALSCTCSARAFDDSMLPANHWHCKSEPQVIPGFNTKRSVRTRAIRTKLARSRRSRMACCTRLWHADSTAAMWIRVRLTSWLNPEQHRLSSRLT